MSSRTRTALAALAGAALLASAAGASAARPVQSTSSSNWAGYAVKREGGFSAASASWVQPRASCTPGERAYAAFWVGIGGFADDAEGLQQIGTAADCDEAGTQRHYAWYELLPAPPVNLTLRIAVGDRVSASVAVAGGRVTLRLANATRGTSVTKTFAPADPPDVSSAEWVAEAPSACGRWRGCRPLPLTNFGKIRFTRASATAAGHTGTISDRAWTPIAITLAGGDPFSGFRRRFAAASADATPGALAAGGASFAVTWRRSGDRAAPAEPYDPRAW